MLLEGPISEVFDYLLLEVMIHSSVVVSFPVSVYLFRLFPQLLVKTGIRLDQAPAIHRLTRDIPIDQIKESFSFLDVLRLTIAFLTLFNLN